MTTILHHLAPLESWTALLLAPHPKLHQWQVEGLGYSGQLHCGTVLEDSSIGIQHPANPRAVKRIKPARSVATVSLQQFFLGHGKYTACWTADQKMNHLPYQAVNLWKFILRHEMKRPKSSANVNQIGNQSRASCAAKLRRLLQCSNFCVPRSRMTLSSLFK